MVRKKVFRGCKKGNSALEVLFVIVFMMLLGIAVVLVRPVLTEINTDIQADTELDSDARELAQNLHDRYPKSMDDLFVIAFALLWIGTLIAAFYIDAHPVFLFAGVMMLIVLLIVGGIINNVYADTLNDPSMVGMEQAFPKITFFMENLIALIILITMSIMIVLYGKTRMG